MSGAAGGTRARRNAHAGGGGRFAQRATPGGIEYRGEIAPHFYARGSGCQLEAVPAQEAPPGFRKKSGSIRGARKKISKVGGGKSHA